MAKRKKKVILDEEKSEFYGSGRKPMSTRRGQVFKDKKKYNRKEKYKRDYEKDSM